MRVRYVNNATNPTTRHATKKDQLSGSGSQLDAATQDALIYNPVTPPRRTTHDSGRQNADIQATNNAVQQASRWVRPLQQEIGRVIVGQKYLVDRLMIGLISSGHILLEGVPGLAKTLSLRTLAAATQAQFQRIQFTPDMLPADVVGTLIYNPSDRTFQISGCSSRWLSARSPLQQRLAERWNVKPESITVADVNARLNGEAEGVRAVSEMADRVRFSPEALSQTDLRSWNKQVIEELKQLKT